MLDLNINYTIEVILSSILGQIFDKINHLNIQSSRSPLVVVINVRINTYGLRGDRPYFYY
ncbi:hypothetical protein [Anabaenopsis arnoldii]|uniref:Uncharacterized protein n=1 Tax=Anabaenopsis arnoldii TaxID=2152938 RepID=A0ABT5ANL5_9CYAN|nr:hypothetical protein [Anabaenopsis arnoldii]MDB9538913.1 hypothetical protein [Anabaenopsis arnoldii]MDH6091201.1 hypothetical protein [Anabaenopsis arnoldii]